MDNPCVSFQLSKKENLHKDSLFNPKNKSTEFMDYFLLNA
jgi:hypothetical protein